MHKAFRKGLAKVMVINVEEKVSRRHFNCLLILVFSVSVSAAKMKLMMLTPEL